MSALVRLHPLKFPSLLNGEVHDYYTRADYEKLWKFDAPPSDRIAIVWARTAPQS